jgi:putative membrane protein
MVSYPVLKALHLIFMVSWFAGLFYLVRLFIYDVEARAAGGPEARILSPQFAIMQKRLWFGITVPASLLTAVFGFWMMVEANLWQAEWFRLKLLFLLGLYGYHLACGRMRRRLQENLPIPSSKSLRLWNEVATVFLVAIIPLATLKTLSAPWPFILGFTLFGVVVFGLLAWRRRSSVEKGLGA